MADESERHGQTVSPRISRRAIWAGALGVTAAGLAGLGAWLSRTPVGLLDGHSRSRAIDGDSVLPQSVDVLIIGGGFVGAFAALALAERGVSVALCEKGAIAGEASGRSMGYVDSQLLDPIKLELVSHAKRLWRELDTRIGLDAGYRPTGLVQALADAPAREFAQGWVAQTRAIPEMESRILSARELEALLPDMRDPPAAALHTLADGSVEPQLAAPAVAEAARRHGARILQQCAVRGLETKAGRVSAAVTEKGTIACQAVILAGGAWSSLFLKSLGLPLPQLNIYLSMMALSAVPGPKVPYSAGSYGFRPQVNGDYTFGAVDFAAPIEPATLGNLQRLWPAVRAFWPMASVGFSPREFWNQLSTSSRWSLNEPSPFEARRVQVPEFRAGPLQEGLKELRAHFPIFEGARIVDRWTGVISSTPDNMPVIGPLTRYPGLYAGTAFTFGLTMGPAAGEALADLATGRTPVIDLKPYRYERFSDGSALSFYP